MTLTIQLAPEKEKALREEAARRGVSIEEYAKALLEESLPVGSPISMKMTVYREHSSQSQGFGGSNQRRIGQVHRRIAVLSHKLPHPIALLDAKLVDDQSPLYAHLPQLLLCRIASRAIQ